MSTQNHNEDPFNEKLIARLANEMYAELKGVAGGAQVLQTTQPSSGNNALAGPYPGYIRPYAPTVHPDALEKENKDPLGSGEHIPGSENSFRFGEPHEEEFKNLTHHDRSILGKTLSLEEPSFYFLKNRTVPVNPPVFNVRSVRRDFPALHQEVNGSPLIWLDNAATTHKPKAVIDATSSFYSKDNSNIHRAAHALAARATDLYEGSRQKIQKFIGAADPSEIVFVRGTTEAINLVANSYGLSNFSAGDEIILTTLEHHANIVPWQMVAQKTGAVIRVVPANDRGELILEQYAALLSSKTKLVAVTQVANALGTVNPVEQMIAMAHGYGIPVLVDGAQSSPHMPINVQAMNADFFTISGHKIFGPTGIGVLYGKAALLDAMPPWQGGGSMIKDVTFAKKIYEGIPQKFEAGTPDIAGVVGLGAAVDYLSKVGLPAISVYEHELLNYGTSKLQAIPGLRLIGTAREKASVMSFVLDGYTTQEVGKHLDQHGIAVRSGHHCAQPSLRRFGLESTVRPSLAFYNTREEIDTLVDVLNLLVKKK